MKIQFLNGGLANQAFQYIFARYYELSHPGEAMYMDDSYFALNTVHNGYELEKVFGIRPHMLSECFEEDVWSYILDERRKGKSVPQILCDNGITTYMISEVDGYETFNPFQGEVFRIPCNEYIPEILDYQDDIYYHGYWINKKWFAEYQDIFLQEFSFPEIVDEHAKKYMDAIRQNRSLSIHIRRGDYVTLGWAVETEQYKKMTEIFRKDVTGDWQLFVFSDDIEWCKAHESELGFRQFEKIIYVEGNTNGKNYLDLQLMSNCKAMIMSNSAFCYLAALLNQEKQFVLNPTSREV